MNVAINTIHANGFPACNKHVAECFHSSGDDLQLHAAVSGASEHVCVTSFCLNMAVSDHGLAMTSRMQKHIRKLYEAYGKAAEQDLRTLGFKSVADELQQAVTTCGQAALVEVLVSNACSFDLATRHCPNQAATHRHPILYHNLVIGAC